jgi:hypothetical protein
MGEQMIDRFQMNKSAIVFAMAGVGSWFWPPSDASTRDGHIVAAIFLVGDNPLVDANIVEPKVKAP